MSIFTGGAWDFIVDPGNWSGDTGIGTRILQHLWYSVLAVALSAVIAVPIGLLIGHLRRGEIVVVSLVNALRSLPTLGLLTFLVLLMGLGVMPPILALVILGIPPPLLAGTYAGIASVDRGVVEAARAMGMTELQVLFRVEIPNALPLILGGLRNATLQVIATATVAAYVNLGASAGTSSTVSHSTSTTESSSAQSWSRLWLSSWTAYWRWWSGHRFPGPAGCAEHPTSLVCSSRYTRKSPIGTLCAGSIGGAFVVPLSWSRPQHALRPRRLPLLRVPREGRVAGDDFVRRQLVADHRQDCLGGSELHTFGDATAPASSAPLKTPGGKARTLLIWFGKSLRPVATIAAYFDAVSGG